MVDLIDDPDVQDALRMANPAEFAAEQNAQSIQNKISGLNKNLTGLDLEANTPDFHTGLTPPALGGAPVQGTPSTTNPGWIGTRLPTGKKMLPNDTDPNLIVNRQAMELTPKLFQKNVDLLRNYPNVPESMQDASHQELANWFVNHVKDNLLYLHDNVPQDVRDRSQLWYDGARNIVDNWVQKYGITDSTAAAVLAAMSPQKDWYQNVSLAERVLDTMKGQGDNFYKGFTATPEMMKTMNNIDAFNKPEYNELKGLIANKSLADLDNLPLSDGAKAQAQALWLRLHDETYTPRSYKLVNPEGTMGDNVLNADGSESKVGWGSLGEIAKAIQAIKTNGDQEAINQLMGTRHKVRNFYNNILDPNSDRGDVTIDTHAVAAGLLRPLSGNSIEVAHNFGNYPGKGIPSAASSAATGISGTYPLFAEAYRQAAAERGILPRQMQSITWEAVRGLFPDTYKTAKNNQDINNIWQDFRTGKASIDETRQKIMDHAGGINNPSWYIGPSGGVNALRGSTSDAGELPEPSISGQAAEKPVVGRRTKSSAQASTTSSNSPASSPQVDQNTDFALELARKAMEGQND
jgi:hypothetical protein